MANRTVSVELVAKVEGYTVPIIAAKDETESFDEKVKKSNEDVDKLGKTSVKTAAELKLLGVEADAAKLKLNDTGKGATTSLELVDQKLVETRAKVKAFADEFNRTGSVDSFSLWKQATSDVQGLEKFKKDLTGSLGIVAVDGGKAVAKGVQDGASKGFLAGISSAFQAMPLPIQIAVGVGIGGAILASASFIGAAINGVLTAGVGLGGIALGVVGQLHDPAVVAAFSQLKSSVMVALTGATSVFGPGLAAALDTGRAGLVTFLAALKPGLDALAPVLSNLVGGFVNGLNGAAPEFVRAFQTAVPLLNELAADLPGLLHSVGLFFSLLSGGSAGAQDGLRTLLAVVEGLIIATGVLLRGLSDSFHALTSAFHVLHEVINGNILNDIALIGTSGDITAGMGDKVKSAAEAIAASVAGAGEAAAQAAAEFQLLSKGLDAVFGRTMNVSQATLAWQNSLIGLKDAVQKNGTSLDGMTKQGNANLQTINQSIDSINKLRDANIANGDSIPEANAKYQAQLDQLQKNLIALGFNKQAVKALIDQYRQIPAQLSTTVEVLGLDASIYKLDSVKTKMDDLNGKVVTTYVVTNLVTGQTQTITHSKGYNRWGGLYEHAETGLLSAGIYPPSNPARYAFAEPATGGEAFIPRNGDMNRSRSIWEYVGANWLGARPSGGGGGNITVTLYGGDDLTSAMLGRIRAEVRGSYGGNVQVALGTGAR